MAGDRAALQRLAGLFDRVRPEFQPVDIVLDGVVELPLVAKLPGPRKPFLGLGLVFCGGCQTLLRAVGISGVAVSLFRHACRLSIKKGIIDRRMSSSDLPGKP